MSRTLRRICHNIWSSHEENNPAATEGTDVRALASGLGRWTAREHSIAPRPRLRRFADERRIVAREGGGRCGRDTLTHSLEQCGSVHRPPRRRQWCRTCGGYRKMGSAIKLGERARTSVGGLVVVKEQIVTCVLVGCHAVRITAGQCFLPNHILPAIQRQP
jgi:hypothetical protein